MDIFDRPTNPRLRIIDQLRKAYPGVWRYDQDMNEWVRADGLRVYARAHMSMVDGCDDRYYTRWYKEHNGESEMIFGIGHPRRKK